MINVLEWTGFRGLSIAAAVCRQRATDSDNLIRRTIKGSILALAALALVACGDDGSSSSAQVTVPNVLGDTQAAATTAITGAALTLGSVTQQSSSTVVSGSVISQTPAAGASAASGASVALVVSSGPAPVAVPNVVGDAQAAATAAITGAGLKVGTLTQATSATVVAGEVISENPAAGTSVTGGAAVALVISTGPQTFTVGGTLIGLSANVIGILLDFQQVEDLLRFDQSALIDQDFSQGAVGAGFSLEK